MKNNKNLSRNNEYMVYGINGAESILSSSRCKVVNIYISESFNFDLIKEKRLNQFKEKIEILNKNQFQNKFSTFRTQGIVIYFTYKIFSELDLKESEIIHNCFLILDSIKDPQNLGQILRTAECAGVDGIILPERRSAKVSNSVFQVSQGAFCNLDIIISKNIKYSINTLKENGYWVIGLENSIESTLWYKTDFSGKIGFVFGSEGEGIRPLIKKYCDILSTIPMNGRINSLNVSASVSAILFERNRQLLEKK